MGKFFSTTWTKLKETVSKMSKKARIFAVAAIVIILASSITAAVLLNKVNYVPLYSGLSASEAGQITTVLKEQNVDYRFNGTSEILVPDDQVNALRVSLAAQGYPQTGLSYDIFTGGSEFGATDVETQVKLQYQLQENIRTTINNMNKIEDSIVIVNLPTKSSYVSTSNRTEASAAVMLSLDPGQTLNNSEARAIAEFIMKSIPSLTLDNISIVDSSMTAYDISDDGVSQIGTTYSATQQALAEEMKEVLSAQALRVLEPALGSGNVAVSVNLALDFDAQTVSSVDFAPPVEGETDGLVRSSEVLRDTLLSDDDTADGSVGTDSNGVSGTEYVSENAVGENVTSSSISEIYNYELNEVRTQIEKAQGSVTDLSVAVVINSEVKNADLVVEQVESLVANAIGVDAAYISVAALPFVESANMTFAGYLQQNENLMKSLSQSELIRTGCICAAILLAIVLIFLFLRKILAPKPAPELAAAAAAGGASDQPQIDITVGDEETEEERHARLLAGLSKQSEATKKIEELMNADPDTAVQIIRNWLSEN